MDQTDALAALRRRTVKPLSGPLSSVGPPHSSATEEAPSIVGPDPGDSPESGETPSIPTIVDNPETPSTETPSIATDPEESAKVPSIVPGGVLDPDGPVAPDALPVEEPDLHYRLGRIFKAAVQYSLDPSRRHSDRAQSLLDETIFSMRKRGVSAKEIHRLINKDRSAESVEVTEPEIIESLERSLAGYAEMSGTEYRALQIARLEDVLKMAYEYAEAGNPAHVQMLIASIERLNKMFELETERTVIEVQLVSGQQAGVLLTILDVALTVLLADPVFSKAAQYAAAKAKDPTYFERLVSRAMDQAEVTVIEATGQTLSIDLDRQTIQSVQS